MQKSWNKKTCVSGYMNTLNDLQDHDVMPFKGGDKETCLLRGKRLQTARETQQLNLGRKITNEPKLL